VDILFKLLSIISFVGVGYLIFLFYRKEWHQKVSNPTDSKIKVKLTRFNPFNDVGGNQSFIICILDENNSGCIVTSLHNKENTRLYAKEINNGKPSDKNTLSKEEKDCLQKAINNS